ncbi:MAG TPA: hypothetical protein VGA84_00935, partial [Thermoanaerobaculia bacterium]
MNSRHSFIAAALMLFASAIPAQLTRENPLSRPQYGPLDLSVQVTPFAASDGTDFLVAWLDGRGSIYANRVTGSGEILDGTGIRIPFDSPESAPYRLLGLFYADGVYTLLYKNYDLASPPP